MAEIDVRPEDEMTPERKQRLGRIQFRCWRRGFREADKDRKDLLAATPPLEQKKLLMCCIIIWLYLQQQIFRSRTCYLN